MFEENYSNINNVNLEKNNPDNYRKMSQKKIEIILTNKNSSINKKLISYFDQNLSTFIKNGIIFDWKTAKPEEKDEYLEQGIDEFPVAIYNNKYKFGLTPIMDFLEDMASKNKIKKKTSFMGNQDLDDFYYKEMVESNEQEDEDINFDEEESIGTTLYQRMSDMNQRREQHGQHAVGGQNKDVDRMIDRQNVHQRERSPSPVRQQSGFFRPDNIQAKSSAKKFEDMLNKSGNRSNQRNSQFKKNRKSDDELLNNRNETTNIGNVTDTLRKSKSGFRKSKEDDLMDKFFENMEETPI